MKVTETKLEGCYIIEPQVFSDERGFFFESFQKDRMERALGLTLDFVQDNQSISKQGVLRGLHFQKGTHAQSKLVQVLHGEVLDVVVDLRKGSVTFGQHMKIILSDVNKRSVFVPKGMAHGFLVRSEHAVFSYKCDEYYHRASEGGIIYNDATLDIDWEYPEQNIVLSEKDAQLSTLKELYP